MDPLQLAQRNSIYKSTINVLVVDDFPPILETIREYFQCFGIYNIVTASSTAEAEKILSGNDIRFHCCLFDLGMKDVKNNEFYLMDNYAKTIPFIVISYRQDLETGFMCKSRGARAILAKGSCDFLKNLVAQVNKLALLNLICPQYMEGRMDILCKLVEVLFEKKPLHVNDWAMEANITDRQLRREWAEELGVCAKHSLCVFHIFSHAFNFIENCCRTKNITPVDFNFEKFATYSITNDYMRMLNYCLNNKETIDHHIFKPLNAS